MTTTVPILPSAPSRSQAPDAFIAAADAWVAALPAFGVAINAVGAEVTVLVAQAQASQIAAAASQAAAALSEANAAASAASAVASPGTNATSASSMTIGAGTLNCTIQTGKSIAVGQFMLVAYTANPANYMLAQVTSYTSGTGALVMTVKDFAGSGTYTSWTLSLSAPYMSPNDNLAAMAILAFLNY